MAHPFPHLMTFHRGFREMWEVDHSHLSHLSQLSYNFHSNYLTLLNAKHTRKIKTKLKKIPKNDKNKNKIAENCMRKIEIIF